MRGGRPAALVTGAARRVGAHLALDLARRGYDIALHCHRSFAEAEKVKAAIEVTGMAAEIFVCDLNSVPAIIDLMDRVSLFFPEGSLLVNNASIFERIGFMETDEAAFDREIGVNLKAPFFLTQQFAKAYGAGSVVNILDTDIAQVQTSHFAYMLAKKALADFTMMAARALGPQIRVNGVCPGCMIPSVQNDEVYEARVREALPLLSHPSLDELAEAVHWLATQRHITGQLLNVDGGKHVL